MSTDNKDVYIDRAAVALVDAKIQESKSMISGLMSSWGKPMEGVTDGPMGKVTAPKPQAIAAQYAPPAKGPASDGKVFVTIPMQGMKAFKQLLSQWFEVEVRLTADQSKMLLENLQSMPTPKKMFDAKAIFNLMESLGGK